MTPRSIRRAAERNTLKAARKAASRPQTNSPSEPIATTPEVADEPILRPKDQVPMSALVEETYAKELRNLRLQDARLHRRCEKDLAELRRTIAERKASEQEQVRKAAESKPAAPPPQPSAPPVPLGFEFPTGEPALVHHACATPGADPLEL